jgi:hypothetical protein
MISGLVASQEICKRDSQNQPINTFFRFTELNRLKNPEILNLILFDDRKNGKTHGNVWRWFAAPKITE